MLPRIRCSRSEWTEAQYDQFIESEIRTAVDLQERIDLDVLAHGEFERNDMDLLRKALVVLTPEQLWVNPDCSLETRRWEEVIPALENMVQASHRLRQTVGSGTDTVART